MSASLTPGSSSSGSSTHITDHTFVLCNEELPEPLKAGSQFFKSFVKMLVTKQESEQLITENEKKEIEIKQLSHDVVHNRREIQSLEYEIENNKTKIGGLAAEYAIHTADIEKMADDRDRIRLFSEKFGEKPFAVTNLIAQTFLKSSDSPMSTIEELFLQDPLIRVFFMKEHLVIEQFKNSYDSVVLRNFLASFNDKDLREFDTDLYKLCRKSKDSTRSVSGLQEASSNTTNSSSSSSDAPSSSGSTGVIDSVIQGVDRIEIKLGASCAGGFFKQVISDNGAGKKIVDLMKIHHDVNRASTLPDSSSAPGPQVASNNRASSSSSSSNPVTASQFDSKLPVGSLLISKCYSGGIDGAAFKANNLRLGGQGRGAKLLNRDRELYKIVKIINALPLRENSKDFKFIPKDIGELEAYFKKWKEKEFDIPEIVEKLRKLHYNSHRETFPHLAEDPSILEGLKILEGMDDCEIDNDKRNDTLGYEETRSKPLSGNKSYTVLQESKQGLFISTLKQRYDRVEQTRIEELLNDLGIHQELHDLPSTLVELKTNLEIGYQTDQQRRKFEDTIAQLQKFNYESHVKSAKSFQEAATAPLAASEASSSSSSIVASVLAASPRMMLLSPPAQMAALTIQTNDVDEVKPMSAIVTGTPAAAPQTAVRSALTALKTNDEEDDQPVNATKLTTPKKG